MFESSKWFQGVKESFKVNKKKELVKVLIGYGIALGINIGILFYSGKQDPINDNLMSVFGMVLFAVLFCGLLTFFMILLSGRFKPLEKKLSKIMTSAEKVEQFDRELMGKPVAILEYAAYRFIFTEHYLVQQFKKVAVIGATQVIELEDVTYIETTLYKGASTGVTTEFINRERNEHLGKISFASNKMAGKFLDQLELSKPGMINLDKKLGGIKHN